MHVNYYCLNVSAKCAALLILCAPVLRVQCLWKALLQKCQDQLFEALHYNGYECCWLSFKCVSRVFRHSTIEVDLRHVGTAAWATDRLTPVSWSAHALSTRPGIPLGHSLVCIDLAQCMVDICECEGAGGL